MFLSISFSLPSPLSKNKIKSLKNIFDILQQESISDNPRTKAGPLPVFVNKVLLDYSHTHSFIYCIWLLLCYKSRAE